jgi:phage terminase Nu1 subunit (DNA packaging protein)
MARSELTADTTQLAKFLDVTPRWVRKLKDDGILMLARDADGQELKGRYELLPNNIAYIRYLRRKARLDDTSESEYIQLRNQRMAADAERAELELKLYKGELHRSEDIQFVVANMVTAAKSRLLAIPSRVTRLILGLTDFHKVSDLIRDEIETALRELSGFNRKMFARQNQEYLKAQNPDNSGK